MFMKPLAFVCAVLIPSIVIPAIGQTAGRNTPLTDEDTQVMLLVGDSYDNTMRGIGSVYLYLLTKAPEHAAGFAPNMNQADNNLLQLQKCLLLERPGNRDLHQAMETVISAKASMQTGAQSLLKSLKKSQANEPQNTAIFSSRVDHFVYTFEALELALFKCLILTYGSDNRDLMAAEAVTQMQWDSVESVALAHDFLFFGDRMKIIKFDNKIVDFDKQVASFRSNRNLTLPDQQTVAAALDVMVQKKALFANKARALFEAKTMNKGIDPSLLVILKTDVDAFVGAVHDFIDLLCKKTAPGNA
ncbi:MAG: hypothetical protein PHW60_00295 [Kiritimatiellae bacterium]|nr:hypothetical protein [Kiritimatiellia bacterium]